jgi:glycosyltransferase involved in cell wall biosynthesis
VLFQGLLRYPPNIDAARWLANEVGPALRRQVPDVRIRLVGDHPPELGSLHDPPRVTLVGRVPDITTELVQADLVVAPLRYGSGTRLKIIEAFAQRIPVAATSIGSEGLGAEDGVHLLVGDSTPALVDACARLLREPALRAEVVVRAHELFERRFRSEVIEEEIAALARGIADHHH